MASDNLQTVLSDYFSKLGTQGGKSTSPAKIAAARANGAKNKPKTKARKARETKKAEKG